MEPKFLLSDIASINQTTLQYVHKQIKEKKLSTKREGNRLFIDNPDIGIEFNEEDYIRVQQVDAEIKQIEDSL